MTEDRLPSAGVGSVIHSSVAAQLVSPTWTASSSHTYRLQLALFQKHIVGAGLEQSASHIGADGQFTDDEFYNLLIFSHVDLCFVPTYLSHDIDVRSTLLSTDIAGSFGWSGQPSP
jgi:hypothetical protein